VERIVRDINRDYWMNTQEALAYGIIDTVVGETEKTIAADRAERAVSGGQVLNGASHEGSAPPARTGESFWAVVWPDHLILVTRPHLGVLSIGVCQSIRCRISTRFRFLPRLRRLGSMQPRAGGLQAMRCALGYLRGYQREAAARWRPYCWSPRPISPRLN